MISLDSVEQSILELENKDTSFATCERLAWLYIVRDHVKGYSPAEPAKLDLNGSGELLELVNGRNAEAVWQTVAELAEAVRVLHPKMYASFIEKLKNI